ncbi:hypothetical protein IWW45_007614 [Coemansia sp. RSA 485]|nr:hypothetical protein IWW45_007614 [Coemansia sp. RSA 485]
MLERNAVNTRDHASSGIGLDNRSISKNKRLFVDWHMRYKGFTQNYTRIRKSVAKLETWAGKHSPQLLSSFAPGLGWMGGESIPVRELLRVVSDSPAMRDFLILYHLHDGQRRIQRFFDFGLFGSYECYGQFCSLSWLPSRMLQVVQMSHFKILIFAWCHNTLNYLGIVVDCPESYAEQIKHHVVQMQPQSFRIVDKGLFGQFFDSYVDSLIHNNHDIRDGVISMMPNSGPYTSSSLSHGIRTTVSVMFCADETPRLRVYRYQVTFEIVDSTALGFASVQLKERYWLIRYGEGKYTEVGGAGVVGEFPLISVDEPFYRYCSRVQDEMDDLAVEGFEGFFTLVPGSLDEPLGEDIILPVPFVEVPVPLELR